MSTIRSRLLLLVLAVLLPALAGLGWLIARTYTAEREAHERTLNETARALAQVADATLDRYATVASLLAQSGELDQSPQPTAAELQRFEERARQALRGHGGWAELRDASGVLASTRPTPAPAAASAAPEPLVGIRDTQPLQHRQDPRHAYAAVVEPVHQRGQAGPLLFNLTVTIPPAELQRMMDRQELPPSWVSTVLDQRGVVVARHPGGQAYVGKAATPEFWDTISKQSQGYFESVSLDGAPLNGFHSRTQNGWTVLVAMPRSEYAGRLPAAVQQLLIGALVLLGLSLLAVVHVSRRIAKPVLQLQSAAARMQAGAKLQTAPTGIAECDAVLGAMVNASNSMGLAREDLERRVEDAVERTRAAEQQISQNQRVEALGRLTGGVAHDFNNLLGIIANNAHLIQLHAKDPRVQTRLAATLRAVEAGSRLTQHLQRIARRRTVSPQRVDLTSWLPELLEMLGSFLGRGVETRALVERGTPAVHCDPSELELALINLALNARDAMPDGGDLRLRARKALAEETADLLPGEYVLLSVRDDGEGVDAETAAHVFEPFFTTKSVGKGTGLGLSQVYGFCVQAGGTVRMDSTPGQGTTVSMVLPAADVEVGEADSGAADGSADQLSPASPAPLALPALPSLQGMHVLVVEDEAELAAVTSALLQAQGATVSHAVDADDAVEQLRGGPRVDVVLSDVVMPGSMDGFGLARLVRDTWPHLPLVLISGYAGPAGVSSEFPVLAKPCPPHVLVPALLEAISRSQQKIR